MSITIYNGYKLKPMNSIILIRFLKNVRKEMEKIATMLTSKVLAEQIIELIDDINFLSETEFVKKRVLYDKEVNQLLNQISLEEKGLNLDVSDQIKLTLNAYPYRTAFNLTYRKLEERYHQILITDHRDPEVDMDCILSIIPIRRTLLKCIPFGTKYLTVLHTEQQEFEAYWRGLKEVSYYGYWNNTDPQEDVSERKWKQRELDWNKAIPGYKVEDCFRFDLVKGIPSRMICTPKAILTHIPSLEQRAYRVARDRLFDSKFREYNSLRQAKGVHSKIAAMNDTERWLRSEEGKKHLENEMKRIKPCLIPEITRKLLTTSLYELSQRKTTSFK